VNLLARFQRGLPELPGFLSRLDRNLLLIAKEFFIYVALVEVCVFQVESNVTFSLVKNGFVILVAFVDIFNGIRFRNFLRTQPCVALVDVSLGFRA
jgi:hypothetical protein